jgi:glycylpeptide N-tetradecanoyltransferase
MAEINFLCVHKNYRTDKLAADLISEVTRRVNLRDKWQAVYHILLRFIHQAKHYQRHLQELPIIIDQSTLKN